jgi:hypothetical protein
LSLRDRGVLLQRGLLPLVQLGILGLVEQQPAKVEGSGEPFLALLI